MAAGMLPTLPSLCAAWQAVGLHPGGAAPSISTRACAPNDYLGNRTLNPKPLKYARTQRCAVATRVPGAPATCSRKMNRPPGRSTRSTWQGRVRAEGC